MLSLEDRRVNELYRYYAPNQRPSVVFHPESNTGLQVDVASSPDTALTAFCQLAAIRLNVQRVGISLITHQEQYILAESTRTLDLADTTVAANPDDGLFMGLTECNRSGNLCENTVCLPPATSSKPPPCFTVLDLTTSRFRDAPYVEGPPFMRFYCGTPITTNKNLNIGSFWVLDNRLLSEFTDEQKSLFGTLASLVMNQLELVRERAERTKGMRMGKALSDFVNGKVIAADAGEGKTERGLTTDSNSAGSEADTAQVAFTSPVKQERPNAHSVSSSSSSSGLSSRDRTSSSGENQSGTTTSTDRSEAISSEYKKRNLVFARAAVLIKEAFNVEGCVFYDCSAAFLAGARFLSSVDDPYASDTKDTSDMPLKSWSSRPDTVPEIGMQRRGSAADGLIFGPKENKPLVETLGFAIREQSTLKNDDLTEAFSQLNLSPFNEKTVLQMIGQYPQGNMWSFAASGRGVKRGTSYDRSNGKTTSASRWEGQRLEKEAIYLQKHFPGVRHMLFAPLFDAGLGRATVGCFVFTYQQTSIFSWENELFFLRSFMNNIGAELSRIDAVALSSSKTDFIGSISHELRSPLHGILAAAEFLEETSLDSYQKSLITTQISCSKTLLHVIEHVLDYSKINSFEKDERSATSEGSLRVGRPMAFGSKMQNLYQRTDIAELVEEVVEGAVAGMAHAPTDLSLELIQDKRPASKNSTNGEPVFGFVKNVAVILTLDYQHDWSYVTQPGAVRRILMNILGNSLKYTAAGAIRVRLKVTGDGPFSENPNSKDKIVLTVSDTGKGISPEFLRKKLFSPFNQEDHLSTGCGLGLSIVKSLVDALEGELEVRSEQNVGTTVTVKLPLSRAAPKGNESENPEAKSLSIIENHMALPATGLSVGFIGFNDKMGGDNSTIEMRESRIHEAIKSSVAVCMLDWLRMQPLGAKETIDFADYVVVLADERLANFIKPYQDDMKKKQPRVIALIPSEMTRSGVEKALKQSIRAFEIMSAPFGPRKVCKAVVACERAARTWTGKSRPNHISEDTDPSRVKKDIREGSILLKEKSFIADIPAKPLAGHLSANLEKVAESPPRSLSPSTLSASWPEEMSHLQRKTQKQLTSSSSVNGDKVRRRNDRLLLVDDNRINLRLLETFVRKRRPECPYDTAENGLLALEAARRQPEGYGMIFMDLSMPIMDGLEATRKIRELEKERATEIEGTDGPAPAIIVALTGLANSWDQANAFASGVDLFMTKPVKFKEIGILLDDFFNE